MLLANIIANVLITKVISFRSDDIHLNCNYHQI